MVSPLIQGILIPTNITGNEEKLKNEQRLQHSGRIPYFTFKYLGVGFFVLAALATVARIIVRIHFRRFGLGDCFVLLAIISLSAATTLMVHYTRHLFLVEALSKDCGYIITSEDIKSFGSVLRVAFCFPILSLTATIAVKLYFLVLFRELSKHVSKKITIYIWAVILLTATLGLFSWSASLIACAILNGSHHCMIMFTDKRVFFMNVAGIGFDMATDVMIVIIPVLILRISQMKPTQKLGIATFLCLSIFTFLISAIRLTGSTHRHGQLNDLTWDWFLVHIESCVATIMASVSAFSSFFLGNRDIINMHKAEEKRGKSKDLLALNQELGLKKNKVIDRSGWGDVGREGSPAAALATLTRIHRFLYEDASLMEGTETIHSVNCSVNEESRPYVLSACTEENEGKERVCSLIAPP